MCSRYRGRLHLTFLVLAAAAGLFVLGGPVVAQAVSVNPSNVNGSPGDTVTLEVFIDTAVTEMGAWGMDVDFDTDVLEYSGIDKGGTLSEPLTVEGNGTSSGARVEASSAGDTVTADPGLLVKVLLRVKDSASKNSAVHLDNFTGYIEGAGTTDSVFTVLIAIAVESPADPFLNAEGLHLVTSDSTPSTATFRGTGSVSGDYRWALSSCGAIDSATADAITYTAPATIDEDVCEDTLTLASGSQPDGPTDTIKISVYHPLAVTWPTSAVGLSLNDESRQVTASGGTGVYTFQSSDESVATVDADGDIMPVGVGKFIVKAGDQTFGVFDTENGFLSKTPQIEVINTIVIGNKPADGALLSKAVHQFTATGGRVEGKVYWEASQGTFGADGLYTAPEVAYAPSNPNKYVTVTITAYDQTYNKNHPTPVKTAYNLVVYPTLSIAPPAGFDADVPLSAGDEISLSGRGGDRECTWTVAGPEDVAGGTNCTYKFVAPSQGNFAGVYEVGLSDGNGYTSTFQLKVAMKMAPDLLCFTETTSDGDPNPQPFEVNGASASDYTWEILKDPGDESPVPDPAAFGTWTKVSPVAGDHTNTFNPADVDQILTFYVRVIVENDPNVTEENGLSEIVSGPYRIIPVKTFAGMVLDEGNVGIDTAEVEVTAPADWAAATETDGFGQFGFDLADTGTTYRMRASKAGYVSTDFTSDDLDDDDPQNNLIQLMTAAEDAYITGKVTVEGQDPVTAVHVRAYFEDGGVPVQAGVVRTTETFRFDFEADNGPYTLTASIPGYFATATVPGPLPAVDVDLDLEATTLVTCVDAAGGGTTTFAEVPLGAVDTSGGADEACFSLTFDEETWACDGGGGEVVYEMTAVDQIQREVTFTGETAMAVTLPFDLFQVPPGGFERGEFAVYQAADLEKCTDLEVLDQDRIVATDYVGDGTTGSVTFLVYHLSDFGIGEVLQDGDEGGMSGSSDSRCFVATAAYGSSLDRHVRVLRQFRDVYLLPTRAGRAFVDAYYSLSPSVAEFIAGNDTLRTLARLALLPVVGLSYVMLRMGLFGSFLAFASLVLLCLGLWKMSRGRVPRAALFVAPIVLACLMTAGSAEAREKERARYYGALYGLYVAEDLDDGETKDKIRVPVDVDYDDSWGMQARVGYIYNKYFSVEGMFEYIAAFETKDRDPDAELDVMNFSVNGKLTSSDFDVFVPYIMAGMGIMNAYEEIKFKGDKSEDSDWGIGARVGLGFDYYVNPEWTLRFEGAYAFGTGDVDNVRYGTVALGVGYHW